MEFTDNNLASVKLDPTSPVLNYTAISPATTESTFAASPTAVPVRNGTVEEGRNGTANGYGPQSEGSPKKKQKRNKPTLSCEECVERKTKVSVFHNSTRKKQYFLASRETSSDLTHLNPLNN